MQEVYFKIEKGLVGGAAYGVHKTAISDPTWRTRKRRTRCCLPPSAGRSLPQAGLLRLRKDMNLFANLRPAICYPALAEILSLATRRIYAGGRHRDA
jgi:3-isopropylmalate dehydrogenase